MSKLGKPYSDCHKNGKSNDLNFDSQFLDYIKNNIKKTYSQQHCYSLCIQKHIIDFCNCSSIWLPVNYNDTKYCNFKKIDCISTATRRSFSQRRNNKCMEACPNECDFIEYKVSTTRVSFPSLQYRNYLIKNHEKINSSGISYENIRRAVLKINVFYESMTYNIIKETKALTKLTLFANIGGTLSLTLGISISSIIELAELLVNLIQVYRARRYKTPNEKKLCKILK